MGAALSRANVDVVPSQNGTSGPVSNVLEGSSVTDANGIESQAYDALARGFVSPQPAGPDTSHRRPRSNRKTQMQVSRTSLPRHTHIAAYFTSLLLSNMIQAIGMLINIHWVIHGGVFSGSLCSVQGPSALPPFLIRSFDGNPETITGAFKQAGNVGAALWSFMLALHTFNLLFLRLKIATSAWNQWLTLYIGWSSILFVVLIGPLVIQSKDKGPYFSVSGYWCARSPLVPHTHMTKL
ncbi:hypothetical protein EW146_g1576 [Bondarzewia mesenterica]|uniref:Glucose receptor Git3 N-terminal domain-containing protein n=1 Tax=Bondarzewia mesenterica TaxID=1095465 RepID=A0A4V3XG08_9AGAM|nr:hypothetical protein EW146_g1576 [Bondarzewia mesenterica]